jgi:phage/plasmid-like protein (TIGR03299 family)
MSHNLTVDEDGKAEMMYVGRDNPPWHGLGTPLDAPATAAEAIESARLNWKVKKFKMMITGTDIEVPEKMAVARMNSDDSIHSVLACVGNDYVTIDNLESFDFFDSVVGAGQAIYHTAGALSFGKKIWILAKLPNNIIIKGKDEIEKFILLTTSHDATGALQMMCTPTRVVCWNTLRAAMGDATDKVSIRHTKNAKSKVVMARDALGIAINHYRKFEEASNYLATVSVDAQKFANYLNKVFPLSADSTKVTKEHIEEIRGKVTYLFDAGKGNDIPEIKHTMWTAYNAVTEYADHFKTVRNEKDGESRLQSIWFGGSAMLKQYAWDSALQLAGV